MQEGLGGKHLADRRSQRRPAGLLADPGELLDHLVQPVARGLRAQVDVERRDQARGQAVLRCAGRDARGERGHRLIADVLVDEVGAPPERGDVDAGAQAEAVERIRERLARGAVEDERDRVHRGGDQVRPRARGLDPGGERRTPGALAVQSDRQPARLAHSLDELAHAVRVERARRVVDQDPRGAELGQTAGLRDERVGLARGAGAVDEPRVELALGGGDRLAGLAEIGDVVQGVVEAEDVDPALCRGLDEPADEVRPDRPGADQEAAAEGERKRGLRPGAQRADPLPWALDAALDRRVEATAARDLEVGEPGGVEDLGEPQLLGDRHDARQRLLAEQPDRGVDERRHLPRSLSAVAKVSCVLRLALVAASIFFVLVGTAAATRIVGVGGNKNGENIKIDVGDVIVVSLSAQPASSGYGWRVATINRQVLRPDSAAYVAGARPSTVVGYGGVQVMLFKAIRQGKSDLKLNYRKAGSAVNRTFELNVTVGAAGA